MSYVPQSWPEIMRGGVSPTCRLIGLVSSPNEVVEVVWTPGRGVEHDFIIITTVTLYIKLVISIVHINNRLKTGHVTVD